MRHHVPCNGGAGQRASPGAGVRQPPPPPPPLFRPPLQLLTLTALQPVMRGGGHAGLGTSRGTYRWVRSSRGDVHYLGDLRDYAGLLAAGSPSTHWLLREALNAEMHASGVIRSSSCNEFREFVKALIELHQPLNAPAPMKKRHIDTQKKRRALQRRLGILSPHEWHLIEIERELEVAASWW